MLPRAVLLLLLLAGCSAEVEPPPPAVVDGMSTVESGTPCRPPRPLAEPVALPVQPPPGAVLTDVTEQAGQRLVTGRVAGPVGAVLDHFRSAPEYVVSRDEDEGRAGKLQLFGVRGDVAVSAALLTCPRGFTGFTIATAVTGPSPVG